MSFSASFSGPGGEFSVSGPITDEAGRRCGLTFNPGQHEPTAMVKGFFAAAMQSVVRQRELAQAAYNKLLDEAGDKSAAIDDRERIAFNDAMRCFATAITDLEKAQMIAVKGLHTRANAGLSK